MIITYKIEKEYYNNVKRLDRILEEWISERYPETLVYTLPDFEKFEELIDIAVDFTCSDNKKEIDERAKVFFKGLGIEILKTEIEDI